LQPRRGLDRRGTADPENGPGDHQDGHEATLEHAAIGGVSAWKRGT
jgi:hypothetical protein